MTDLEMTKLCAEAMGIAVVSEGPQSEPTEFWLFESGVGEWSEYDPLQDDAQAMALVRKMELDISHCEPSGWIVFSGDGDGIDATAETLNHAIVECVAKMQKAKNAPQA